MATLKTLFSGMTALSLLVGGVSALTIAPAAMAQSSNSKAVVDSAIARGDVGEQISGYLAVVDGKSVSGDVQASVDDINIKRKSVYARLSASQNVPTATVAQLTGEKQIKKAAQGTYIKDSSGVWKKK